MGTNIIGTLKFGSSTSQNVTIFRNPVNLNGADRTINVDDNPASAADYTVMQGAVTNSTGTAGLIKTGDGVLCLTSASNNYNGNTTITGGVLQENLPTSSFLSLEGGVYETRLRRHVHPQPRQQRRHLPLHRQRRRLLHRHHSADGQRRRQRRHAGVGHQRRHADRRHVEASARPGRPIR